MSVTLYNTNLNLPLARFNGEIEWFNEPFKEQMLAHGINIPYFCQQTLFEGKEVVYPADGPLFKKAIQEVYCKIMHNQMELRQESVASH